MRPVEIKPGIFWVGAIDWNLRDFHGYSRTSQGSTYNAYLIVDETITLFDSVDVKYKDELLCQIAHIVDPEKIDTLVVNHAEPDHSGSLPYIVEATKPQRILTSKMGEKFIQGRFHTDGWPIETVENEQIISLGKRSVQFLETRMLHWPDSMVSYIPEEKLLISQDAFGQNIASGERFDDWIDWPQLKREMAHYYANIILPFSPMVPKAFKKIQDLGWEIDTIAPDHGLILQNHVAETLAAYQEFAAQKPTEKAVIIYDTMWRSTAKMAETLASGLADQGIKVKLFHLKSWHHSDVMGELWDAGALLVGSSTHNNGILPLVADNLTYIKGLKPQNKLGFAFGSYGWSGESPKIISDWLAEMGMDQPEPPFKVKHVPSHDDFKALDEVAQRLAQAIKDQAK